MNKGIALFMSFIIISTLALGQYNTTYADTISSYSKEVKGKVIYKDTGPPVYSVDVSWGAMNFTYITTVTPVWNEATHVYDDTYLSEWKAEGNTIRLTNHSNADVKANFRYIKLPQYNNVFGIFNQTGVMKLPSADGKAIGDRELTGTRELILIGKIDNQLNGYTTVGNIKIEID